MAPHGADRAGRGKQGPLKRVARALRGEISPRRILLRLADAVNARLGRRIQGRFYFEDIYREEDPWGYTSSAYEQAKYAKTLTLLPQPRFLRALEVGCSLGVFTRLLAARADRVVAMDISARACRRARLRCADAGNVRVVRGDLVRFTDPDGFDLIVCAEVLYYLWDCERDRALACRRLGGLLRPGGWLLIVLGGDSIGQEWEAELETRAGLVRHESRSFVEPVRPWRLVVLRKPA